MKEFLTLFLFPLLLLGNNTFLTSSNKSSTSLIETKEAFVVALTNAKDGDELLVGDINFEDKLHDEKSLARIDVSKNVTIKNGKKDGLAVFENGSFKINGTKVSGEKLTITFEGIKFDGLINGSELTDGDWYYNEKERNEPSWAQYAMTYTGNIDANYKDCSFINYAYEQGGAINVFYDEYPSNSDMFSKYGNNFQCKINLSLDNCTFKDNYSYYSGGALYVGAHRNNVSININNSTFEGNKTSCAEFALGGGAAYISEANVAIYNSEFKDNVGAYSYGNTIRDHFVVPEGMPEEFMEEYASSLHDFAYGGALNIADSTLEVQRTNFINNKATNGGAISIYNTPTSLEGCVFASNYAINKVLENSTAESDKGPWSSMGLGGAMYYQSNNGIKLDVYNSSFYQNKARNGYAIIDANYTNGVVPEIDPEINIYLSSFDNNTVDTEYDATSTKIWSAVPGNIWDIPYIHTYASIIIDEANNSKNEEPSEENNYCIFGKTNEKVTFEVKEKQLVVKQTSVNLELPEQYIENLIGKRYFLNSFTVGSNYSSKLYEEEKEPNKENNTPEQVEEPSSNEKSKIVWYITIPIVIVLSAGSIVFVLLKRGHKKEKVVETAVEENVDTVDDDKTEEILLKITSEYKITEREKEVLRLLLKGKKRQDIANELFLSESSIKKYTSSIYAKIGVHSKLDLIMKYKK